MSSAERYLPRYTVDDYVHWEGRWQLIDGAAIAMSPSPFGKHQRIVSEIQAAFHGQIKQQACKCRVYASLDWIVADDTVVCPDVMIVCGNQPDRHLEEPPVLVVEVHSESTRKLDQTTKRQIFADHGVGYYIMVEPIDQTIEIISVRDCKEVDVRKITIGDDAKLNLDNDCQVELVPSVIFQ